MKQAWTFGWAYLRLWLSQPTREERVNKLNHIIGHNWKARDMSTNPNV